MAANIGYSRDAVAIPEYSDPLLSQCRDLGTVVGNRFYGANFNEVVVA